MNRLLPLLSLILSLSIFCGLNYQLTYSQSSEDPKSLNCKDNADQSKYVSNVSRKIAQIDRGLLQTIFQDFII